MNQPTRPRLLKVECLLFLPLYLGLFICAQASAEIFDRPKNGKVVERTNMKEATLNVWVTDKDGNDIQPQLVTDWQINSSYNWFRVFTVPKKWALNIAVKDFRQELELTGNTGEVSDLKFESINLDPDTNEFVLFNVFGVMAQKVGLFQDVIVPDLFADTDDSGDLGAGDVLYSLVDVNVYLDNIPSITEGGGGASFNIVGGVTSALPGMLFSTTPFSFNPTTGFSGTDFTGIAFAEATHTITATPEPSTGILLGVSFVGLAGASRRLCAARTKRGTGKAPNVKTGQVQYWGYR